MSPWLSWRLPGQAWLWARTGPAESGDDELNNFLLT